VLLDKHLPDSEPKIKNRNQFISPLSNFTSKILGSPDILTKIVINIHGFILFFVSLLGSLILLISN